MLPAPIKHASKMAAKGLETALNWLLPPLCPATGQDVDAHGMVAADYWSALRFIRAPYCHQCAMPFPHDIGGPAEHLICGACMENPPHFSRGRAALVYDDTSRQLILRFKHGDQLQAVRTLAPWLTEAGRDILAECDVVIPVPLHRWRLLKRRYNQSALLARAIARAAKKPMLPDTLQRIRATPPQAHRKRAERADNVKNAFRVRSPESLQGKKIVLLDDVMTTGATLNACTDALMSAGALSVDVLCVARVVKD